MKKYNRLKSVIAGVMSMIGPAGQSDELEVATDINSGFKGLDSIHIQPLNERLPLYIAGHRSHQSHSSHQSHRSSSGSSYRYPSSPKTTPSTSDPLGQPAKSEQIVPADQKVKKLQETMENKEKLKNLIMRVQLTLQTLGYYQDVIDGVMGPETRKSLNQFRISKGLATSEKLDVATLNALAITVY